MKVKERTRVCAVLVGRPNLPLLPKPAIQICTHATPPLELPLVHLKPSLVPSAPCTRVLSTPCPCLPLSHSARSMVSTAAASRSTDTHTPMPMPLNNAGKYDNEDEEEVRPRWR